MTTVRLRGESNPASREPTPNFRNLAPGLVIAGMVALAASWLAEHYPTPVMLFALLGARITFGQIQSLGGGALLLTAGLARNFGLLTGGSVAICGASAALAIASVLPRGPDHERDTIMTVVAVTALSTIAMVLYPVLAGLAFLGR